jgi:hypothetical protein
VEKGFETNQPAKKKSADCSWTGLLNNVHVSADNTLWKQMHGAGMKRSSQGRVGSPRVCFRRPTTFPDNNLQSEDLQLLCGHSILKA